MASVARAAHKTTEGVTAHARWMTTGPWFDAEEGKLVEQLGVGLTPEAQEAVERAAALAVQTAGMRTVAAMQASG
jgi:hypothetical protein